MNADEQLAHDFVSAWSAHDRPRARSYVTPDATAYAALGATTTPRQATGPAVLWRRNRLDEALGSELRVDGCYEIGAPSQDASRIGCLYTVDLLGLGELGRGPFPDNLFLVTVEDGKVVSLFTAIGANDYDEEGWGPFLAWVEDGHGPDSPTSTGWTTPTLLRGRWAGRSAPGDGPDATTSPRCAPARPPDAAAAGPDAAPSSP